MGLKLYWADFSQRELQKIFQYYREKAGIRIAKKLIDGIYNQALKIKKQPKIGQVEELLKKQKTRIQIFSL